MTANAYDVSLMFDTNELSLHLQMLVDGVSMYILISGPIHMALRQEAACRHFLLRNSIGLSKDKSSIILKKRYLDAYLTQKCRQKVILNAQLYSRVFSRMTRSTHDARSCRSSNKS